MRPEEHLRRLPAGDSYCFKTQTVLGERIDRRFELRERHINIIIRLNKTQEHTTTSSIINQTKR